MMNHPSLMETLTSSEISKKNIRINKDKDKLIILKEHIPYNLDIENLQFSLFNLKTLNFYLITKYENQIEINLQIYRSNHLYNVKVNLDQNPGLHETFIKMMLEFEHKISDEYASHELEIIDGMISVFGSKTIIDLFKKYKLTISAVSSGLGESNTSDLLLYAIAFYQFNIAIKLIDIGLLENVQQDEISEVLGFTRTQLWERKFYYNNMEVLCDKLRALRNESIYNYPDNILVKSNTIEEIHKAIFGFNASTLKNKDDTTRIVLSQYYMLLKEPKACIPYLQFLNSELERYYMECHGETFPVLQASEYYFKDYEQYSFPVPTDKYIGIKKHSALREYLLSLFEQHNLDQTHFKLFGLVDSEVINKIVKNTAYFTESRYHSLFHNKYSHMIQQAILIYAIEAGEFDLSYYDDNGKQHYLSAKEILSAHIEQVNINDQDPCWNSIRDNLTRDISFTDPFWLSSAIMHDKIGLNTTTLSDYMIDSFNKGVISMFQALKEKSLVSDIDDCFEKICDFKFNVFHNIEWIFEHSLKQEKNSTSFFKSDQANVVIKCHHTQYNNFKAIKYLPEEEIVKSKQSSSCCTLL